MAGDAALGRAVLELSTDDTKFNAGLEKAKGTAKRLGKDFKDAGESVQGFGAALDKLSLNTADWSAKYKQSFTAVGQAAGILVGAIAAVGAGVVLLGQRGAAVDDVASAFNRLAGDGPKALAGLRDGIGGLLTDYDLMKPMNAALSAGFKMNAADAYTMARAAWILADAQGKDLKESYETIAQAMATGKVAALGALGLNVELKGAALELKNALASEGEAITSNAVKMANRQAAMEAMNRVVLAAGPQELDFAEKLTRVKVQIGNMTDSLGVAIATSPVLGVAMNAAGDALQTAFGANQTKTIQALVVAIGQIAIVAVQSATYVVAAAAEIASAYYKTRAAVDTLFQAFNDREIARVEGLVKTFEAIAATSTSATSASKLRLQELRIELERLKGVSKGFTVDANDSLATQGRLAAANEKAQKFLDDMIRSMQKAQAEGASATAIAKGLANAHVELAGGVRVATAAEKEQAKAIAEILAAAIPLTDAQKEAALANEVLGISAETTAKALGISAAAVSTYLDSVKGIKEIDDVWAKAHVDMLAESKKFINKWLADSTAARQKDADASAKAIADQLLAAAEYHEKNYQLTLSDSERTIRQINLQRDAAIAALKKQFDIQGPLYDKAKGEIDQYYDGIISGAKKAQAALDFSKVLTAVSSAFQQAGQSAGGAIGSILNFAGQGVAAIEKLGSAMKAYGAIAKATAAQTVSAGVSMGMGAIGLVVMLGQYVDHFNDAEIAAAREVRKAFVDAQKAALALAGSMAELQRRVESLGMSWAAVSAGFGRPVPVGTATIDTAINRATSAIDQFNAAWAKTPQGMAEANYKTQEELQKLADDAKATYDYMLASGKYSASELARAFDAMTSAQKAAISEAAQAQQDAIDKITAKYKDQIDALDNEYKTLSDSVGKEAEEAVMGAQETQDRARMAQIEKDKAALEQKKQAEIDAAQQAADKGAETQKAAATAAAEIWDENFGKAIARGYVIPITFSYPNGMPGGFPEPPAVPMAGGGSGRVTRPTLFYSKGDEDFAFSGEGRSFGLGKLATRPIEITTISQLDGRVVAKNQARYIPDELARVGVRSR